MRDSILNTIKKVLGLDPEYKPFDEDIILYINSALFVLFQLGVGPKQGFSIQGSEEVWGDFLPDQLLFESVKEYIATSVQLAFDPPSNSFVMTAKENKLKELEWRINVQAEGSTLYAE